MKKYYDITPHEDAYTENGEETVGRKDKAWAEIHGKDIFAETVNAKRVMCLCVYNGKLCVAKRREV